MAIRFNIEKIKMYALAIIIPLALGGIVGFITSGSMDYDVLRQPALSPPGFLFPIVWTILYILMGVSFGLLMDKGVLDDNAKWIYYIQNYSFGGVHMANKTANVTARVQPEIKKQAEAVLEKIGIPVSVLIDTLYRQIIMTGSVPYSLSVPKIPTLDSMSEEQFDDMMQKGYDEAKAGIGLPENEAFDKIREVKQNDGL